VGGGGKVAVVAGSTGGVGCGIATPFAGNDPASSAAAPHLHKCLVVSAFLTDMNTYETVSGRRSFASEGQR
jgi:hypothetical protein